MAWCICGLNDGLNGRRHNCRHPDGPRWSDVNPHKVQPGAGVTHRERPSLTPPASLTRRLASLTPAVRLARSVKLDTEPRTRTPTGSAIVTTCGVVEPVNVDCNPAEARKRPPGALPSDDRPVDTS